MKLAGAQEAFVAVGQIGRRRQPHSFLEKLCRGGGRAAPGCRDRALVDHGGDGVVGCQRRRREMPPALLRILGELGQACMDSAATCRRQTSDRSLGQQRVTEADLVATLDENAGFEGRVEDRQVADGHRDPVDPRPRERRDGRDGGLRRGRQTPEPISDETSDLVGSEHTIRRRRARLGPRELQCDERVAAREALDALQRRARERMAELVRDDARQRVQPERSDDEPPEALVDDRDLSHPGPGRGEQPDRVPVAAAQREAQRSRRRRVEPLEVVDRDEHRPVLRRRPEQPQRPRRHGTGRRVARRSPQKRGAERIALRGRQRIALRVEQPAEEIREPAERRARLGLRAAG